LGGFFLIRIQIQTVAVMQKKKLSYFSFYKMLFCLLSPFSSLVWNSLVQIHWRV